MCGCSEGTAVWPPDHGGLPAPAPSVLPPTSWTETVGEEAWMTLRTKRGGTVLRARADVKSSLGQTEILVKSCTKSSLIDFNL